MDTKRKTRIVPALLIILALVALLVRWGDKKTEGDSTKFTTEFPIFDTVATVTLHAPRAHAMQATKAAMDRLRKLHDTINLFDPESELALVNRTAATHPVRCSKELWDLLLAAKWAYEETDGAFDVTIGPLMTLWGLHRKRETLPSDEDVRRARQRVGFDKLVLDHKQRTITFSVPGMRIDFGGIAKGYALDLVVQTLEDNGVRCGLIDLGGNITCLKEPPPGRDAYVIGLRDPFAKNRLLRTLRITSRAVATSGNYERQIVIEGKTIQHIVDPRTGQPVANFASITVITPKGLDSDVWSTAIFVGGQDLAEQLVRTVPNTGVVFVTQGEEETPTVRTLGSVTLSPP